MAKVSYNAARRQKQKDEKMAAGLEMQAQEQKKKQEQESITQGRIPTEEEISAMEEGEPEQPAMDIRQERKVIGKEEVRKATETLKKYKDGKSNLERRIIENEQWWKMRHWDMYRNAEGASNEETQKNDAPIEPKSAWLFNSIANKHADAMDNYPEPSVLPRAIDDDNTAKALSSILPVIIEQNDYEQVYSDVWWYKLKTGTGVKGVFWNNEKQNGLGDIDIKKCDILNLFWEPGISDIQDSRNVFHVSLMDNDLLNAMYPELDNQAKGNPELNIAKYVYDDKVDTTEKSVVVDWYYKKMGENGKTVLHYVKYVNETVLYASENDGTKYGDGEEPVYERGYYDHGKYPFVFDTLFVTEGTPCGFGYIDIMKDCQMYIDKMNADILENSHWSAKPRFIVRDDGGINEEEFSDTSRTFYHANGNLGEDSFRQIENAGLSGIYTQVLANKIDELKETSGNRDFSQGSTSSGVTAASAISALMEAGSKLTRDMLKSAYRAFVRECYLIIELIRQFYDEPRCFRIIGEDKKIQFTNFSNAGMKPQMSQEDFGMGLNSRVPVFDITVTAAKKSTYSRMSQNELALQFYNLGFFNPEQTDQTLACIEMMDFDGKDKIIEKVKENGTLFDKVNMLQQQMVQMASIIDQQNNTDMAPQLAGNFEQGIVGQVPQQSIPQEGKTQAEQSADRVRESTAVDGRALE